MRKTNPRRKPKLVNEDLPKSKKVLKRRKRYYVKKKSAKVKQDSDACSSTTCDTFSTASNTDSSFDCLELETANLTVKDSTRLCCSETTVKEKDQGQDLMMIDLTGSDSENESFISISTSTRLYSPTTVEKHNLESRQFEEEFEIEIVDVVLPQTLSKMPEISTQSIPQSETVVSPFFDIKTRPQKSELNILDQTAVLHPATYVTGICDILASNSEESCHNLQNSLNEEMGLEKLTSLCLVFM